MKSYKTIDQQIDLLQERDLVIENEEFAKQLLSTISYYRLVSYRHDTGLWDRGSKKYINNKSIEFCLLKILI